MNLEALLSSPDFKRTSNHGQLRYKCIFCGEIKYKLYIHIIKRVYICHKCGTKGKLDGNQITQLDEFQRKVEVFKNGKERSRTKSFMLPSEIITPIERNSGIPYLYLKKRGLTESDIRKYRIGYCSEGLYRERVIIPFYGGDSQLLYFIARTYTNRQPRYLNVGAGRKQVLFKTFEGIVDVAVLVEGCFDAISVGKVMPAIALLGKICSDYQAKEIANSCRSVYVMLDKDAKKNTFDISCLLSHYLEAIPIFIKHKDPGEMNEEQIKEALQCEFTVA